MNFANILTTTGIGANWLLVLIFIVVASIYGFFLGRQRLTIIIVAGYFSLVINKAIPWAGLGFLGVKGSPGTNVEIFLFLALVIGIFFLMHGPSLSSAFSLRGRGSWWQVIILGFFQLGFMASVVISFLPQKTINDLDPFVQQMFNSDLAKFLWLLLPVVAILILKKKRIYKTDD